MLVCTVAVGSCLEFERASDSSRRLLWLIGLTATSVAAVWVHYTGALVVGPLLAMALLRRCFRRGEALALLVVVGLGWLALLPTLIDQLGQGNEEGVASSARLTLSNLVEALGTPFDGRFGGSDLTLANAVGALALSAAALALARSKSADTARVRAQALPLAYVPLAALIIVTAAGPNVLITRYTAVAAPMMLVVLAAGVLAVARPAGVAIGGAALAGALAGSIASHTHEGLYPDLRAATEQITAGERAGDVVLVGESPGTETVVHYYLVRQHSPLRPVRASGALPQGSGAPRVWLVRTPPRPRRELDRALARFSYRASKVWRFTAGDDQQLVLAVSGRG
jgi:hypothetical protein